ncbi:hypothetical protein G0Q06_08690 [Puniceicoccales bacterium CK1056]|uniref:Outer membrane lipoprotein-sorting protein n=1 Tax=Oceanipulchritudo coccoides TaxID=2706888 RepID=A0A6B2M3X8_9BACT|nr:hypothetical protein [Oceanipulchritudo coccoides]NDV62525.1 hypothetical protein [Oceanipulchritudo coccoides]
MNLSPKPFRIIRSGFFYLVLVLVLSPALKGQFKFREPPNRQLPDSLNESVGQDFWEWFLYNRAAGVFEIGGILTHRPAGASSVTYNFLMQGDWQTDLQDTSITLTDESGETTSRHVIKEGLQTRMINSDKEIFLDEGNWREPVIHGFPITWMDLLMPYYDWEDVVYLGPDRYLGRPAHRYSLANPDPEALPAKVIVTLDADYAAVLKAELLDGKDSIIKRMRVGGIKKFEDNWMFSELNWENRRQRSSIRLKVYSYKTSSR